MESLNHLTKIIPLTEKTLGNLSYASMSSIDMLIYRFSKLQDNIGQKIFPKILSLMGENVQEMSLIDILHHLEKLGFLHDKAFWDQMRSTRNELTQEYPDQLDKMANNINTCAQNAKDLVDYWESLKVTLEKRIFDVM